MVSNRKEKAVLIITIFLIVAIGIFIFLFKPCDVRSSSDILIDVVPISSNSLQVTIHNNSPFPVSFSENYHIEAKTLLLWHEVNLRSSAFTSLGHELSPGGSYSISVDYSDIYGVLSPGQYRLVKTFKYNNISTSFAGYFSIK